MFKEVLQKPLMEQRHYQKPQLVSGGDVSKGSLNDIIKALAANNVSVTLNKVVTATYCSRTPLPVHNSRHSVEKTREILARNGISMRRCKLPTKFPVSPKPDTLTLTCKRKPNTRATSQDKMSLRKISQARKVIRKKMLHTQTNPDQLICPACHRIFEKQEDMLHHVCINHQRVSHITGPQEEGRLKPLQFNRSLGNHLCPICHMVYATAEGLSCHMKHHEITYRKSVQRQECSNSKNEPETTQYLASIDLRENNSANENCPTKDAERQGTDEILYPRSSIYPDFFFSDLDFLWKQ